MDSADQEGRKNVGDETRAWLMTELPALNITPRPRFRHWRAITMLLGGLAIVAMVSMFFYNEELLAWKRGRHEERRALTASPRPVVATPTMPPESVSDAAPTKATRRPTRRLRSHARRAPLQLVPTP